MTAKRISALFFIIMWLASLSSCGRTGNLYLPDEKADEKPVAEASVKDSSERKN